MNDLRKVRELYAGRSPYLAVVAGVDYIMEVINQSFFITRQVGDAFSDVKYDRGEAGAR